jgi:hypothetical protein
MPMPESRKIAHTDGNGYYTTGSSSAVSPHEVRHGQYSQAERSASASSPSASSLRVVNSGNSDSSGSTLDQKKYDQQQNTIKKAKASSQGR